MSRDTAIMETRPGRLHLLNPNLSEDMRRERTVHNEYLKRRHHELRTAFINLCGNRCEMCLQVGGNLKIRHRTDTGFIFQRISYLKRETRDKILADCYVICQHCINLDNHRKNPDHMVKMQEKRIAKRKILHYS